MDLLLFPILLWEEPSSTSLLCSRCLKKSLLLPCVLSVNGEDEDMATSFGGYELQQLVFEAKNQWAVTGSSHSEASGVDGNRLASLQPGTEIQPKHALPRALHSHPSLLVFLLGSFRASPQRFPCGTRQAGNHKVSCELSCLGHSERSGNTEFYCEVTKSKDSPMPGWESCWAAM